jgi:transcription termination factor Rho
VRIERVSRHTDLARRAIDAIARDDLSELLKQVHDDVELHPLVSVWERTYRGHAGIEQWRRDRDELWEEFGVWADGVRDLNDHTVLVVAHWRGRARGAGEMGGPVASVVSFRGEGRPRRLLPRRSARDGRDRAAGLGRLPRSRVPGAATTRTDANRPDNQGDDMSVLDRSELEASPLADLHAIANELGIDGFRRLRKAELVDAILGEEGAGAAEPEEAEPQEKEPGEAQLDQAAVEEPASRPVRSRRRGRRGAEAAEPEPELVDAGRERIAEGVVELLGNGSAFLRVDPPEPSAGDVYISAAQVRRCELVSGDRVSGPVRAPRRSERYASLVRVEEINGAPAEAVAEGTPFEDLPCAFPNERFSLGVDDPTLRAIEWLTPLGRGSRAVIVGGARAGKTEALRRLTAALADQAGLDVSLVLVGVRPEEIGEWRAGPVAPAAAHSLAASADAQGQSLERAVETARRVAARGGHAVVLVDTLDGLHVPAARKALAAARRIVDGGSLTVIATAGRPFGGETTVIALDAVLTSTGRLPALDLAASGTLHPELLVGEAGADAIAQARAAALE